MQASLKRIGSIAAVLAASAFAAAFQGAFYSRELFNSGYNGETRIDRMTVLADALTTEGVGLPKIWSDAAEQLGKPQNLLERLPPLLIALGIAFCALLIGGLLLAAFFHRVQLDRLERLVLSFGLGMACISLLTQLLGLIGFLAPMAMMAAAASFIATLFLCWLWRRTHPVTAGPNHNPPDSFQSVASESPTRRFRIAIALAILPFVALSMLAASMPTPDYDAQAYHLLGPKEYWLAGRIQFLPHNVYTSFPFLTEMFHLLGMILLGNWFYGGLAGQLALSLFVPATALMIALLARRQFGSTAGWIAPFLYLSTPWSYRLSAIPYVEGALLFYLTAAVYCAMRVRDDLSLAFLAGCMAGNATACKYTGLVMAIIPAGCVVAFNSNQPQLRAAIVRFLIGALLFIGPWLVRNVFWTGNPVFPLGYAYFDGDPWSADQAVRFAAHHRAIDFSVASLARYIREIPLDSDWQNALIFAFAPLAILHGARRKAFAGWALVTYLFAAFWLWTHRLDRFWLPLEPFAVVLAAGGMTWTRQIVWRSLVLASCAFAAFYNLAYCTTWMCGLNLYTDSLAALWQRNVTAAPAMAVVNLSGLIQPAERVLHVGFAAVYYSTSPAVYNTVFNDSPLVRALDSRAEHLDDAAEARVREILRANAIDWLVVDWTEIVRHRKPGGYGFPDAIQPALLDDLVRRKVLEKVRMGLPSRIVVAARDGAIELGTPADEELSSRHGDAIAVAESIEVFRVLRQDDAP